VRVAGRVTASGEYALEATGGAGTATLVRRDTTGTATLATLAVPAGATWAARLHIQADQVSARLWPPGDPEPAAWAATVTDTAITGPGAMRIDASAATAGAASIDDVTHDDPTNPDPTVAAYTWGPDGRLTTEAFPDGTRTWAWLHGRLDTLTQALPGAAGTTTFTYTPAGLVHTETTAAGTLTYAYDPAGQLTAAAGPAGTTTWAYDTLGRRVGATSPAGDHAHADLPRPAH